MFYFNVNTFSSHGLNFPKPSENLCVMKTCVGHVHGQLWLLISSLVCFGSLCIFMPNIVPTDRSEWCHLNCLFADRQTDWQIACLTTLCTCARDNSAKSNKITYFYLSESLCWYPSRKFVSLVPRPLPPSLVPIQLYASQREMSRWTKFDFLGLFPKSGKNARLVIIGTSLSEPHTSVTALCMCVVCMLACLWQYTVNFKWACLRISQGLNLGLMVGEGLLEGSRGTGIQVQPGHLPEELRTHRWGPPLMSMPR